MISVICRSGCRTLLLSAALLATTFVGSAVAAGESIYITPPTSAQVGIEYSFTATGYTPQTEKLYVFNDFYHCGSSPHVEHAVHHANGDDYTVDGNFQDVSSNWKSPQARSYYVCAYLVDASEPFNPSQGVITEKFDAFHVHVARAVLGSKSAFSNGAGFGSGKPQTVYLGGDPTGRVTSITWQRWGQLKARGFGRGWCPGTSVANGHACRYKLIASNLGLCQGQVAYRSMAFYSRADGRWSFGSKYNACSGKLQSGS